MSDNSFFNFGSILGRGGQSASTQSQSNALLLNVPESVQDESKTLRHALKLQGEVIRENADNSVRIRTERGDIVLKPQDTPQRYRRGAHVEIEVRPESKRREGAAQAHIRVTRDAPPSRDSSTPVDVRITPRPSEQTQSKQNEGSFLDRKIAAAKAALERKAQDIKQSVQDAPSLAKAVSPPEYQPFSPKQGTSQSAGLPDAGTLVRLSPIAASLTPGTTIPFIDITSNLPPLAHTGAFNSPLIEGGEASASSIKTAATQQAPLLLEAENTILTPQREELGTAKTKLKGIDTLSLQVKSAKSEPKNSLLGSINTNYAVNATQKPFTNAIDVQIDGFFDTKQSTNLEFLNLTQEKSIKIQSNPAENILKGYQAHQMQGIVSGIHQHANGLSLPLIEVSLPLSGQIQQFTMQAPSEEVQVGTRIHFTPVTGSTPQPQIHTATGASALPPLPLSVAITPGAWPLMNEMQSHLYQALPAAVQSASGLMPNTAQPAQMAPAMMFFVAAVRGGDLSSWMGDKAMEALKNNPKGLLSKLMQEGQALSRAASESPSPDWRIVNVPMQHEGQIQKLALYYRHEGGESEDRSEGTKGTRFVFDLALNRMGTVQVDGLYRPVSSDSKRLDLVVRTDENFGEATRAEMRRIYASALRSTDVSGSLDFQGGKTGWVTINAQSEEAMGVEA